VLLTLLALFGQTAPFVFSTSDTGRPWAAIQYIPVLVVALPVIWRRHAPVVCLMIAAAGVTWYSMIGRDGPEQPVWYGALVLMYTVADLAPRWQRVVTLVVSTVGVVVVGGAIGSIELAIKEAFLWGAAYALGRAARFRRAELDARAAMAERDRVFAAERERARIARDMHDILAHAVSLMVVQAEAGPVALRSAPAKAEAAFDAIAAAGRDAMTQLRRTLGLLKETDAPRSPQPTLGGVPDLVAGVPPVRMHTSGTALPVAPDVEVAAYRIVQEALTNIVKHADPATASVSLEWTERCLVITVDNDGVRPGKGGGLGLIGISERAAACGGRAECGPVPGTRGFRVAATLPVEGAG
jgi:signal transduction histidine kinase